MPSFLDSYSRLKATPFDNIGTIVETPSAILSLNLPIWEATCRDLAQTALPAVNPHATADEKLAFYGRTLLLRHLPNAGKTCPFHDATEL